METVDDKLAHVGNRHDWYWLPLALGLLFLLLAQGRRRAEVVP